MGTKSRRIVSTVGIASLLGVAGIAGIAGTVGEESATVRATRSAAVSAWASADALERRALTARENAPVCDAADFTGSIDAYERRSVGCVEPAAVFYGSPDSVERQAGQ